MPIFPSYRFCNLDAQKLDSILSKHPLKSILTLKAVFRYAIGLN